MTRYDERSRLRCSGLSVCLLLGVAILSLGTDLEEEPHRPWEGQFLYGREMMTDVEKRRFWQDMRALRRYEDQLEHWQAHIDTIRARASERGLSIQEPPEVMAPGERSRYRRPIFGHNLMSVEEIEAYRAKEVQMTAEEQEVLRREHAEAMRKRADSRGLSLDEEWK